MKIRGNIVNGRHIIRYWNTVMGVTEEQWCIIRSAKIAVYFDLYFGCGHSYVTTDACRLYVE